MKKNNNFSDASYVLVTSDADWSSESCLEFFCKKMAKYNIKPLIFATNFSKILIKYFKENKIDIGIHPNFKFNSTQGKNKKEILKNLLRIYPMAKISRSHSFIDSYYIRSLLINNKIKFDSNILNHLCSGVKPVKFLNGITRYPVYWSDGMALLNTQKRIPLIKDLEINKKLIIAPGLKVLNIHTFNYSLNLPNLNEYKRYKKLTQNLTKKQIINNKSVYKFGIQDYVSVLLKFIIQNNIKIIDQKKLLKFYD